MTITGLNPMEEGKGEEFKTIGISRLELKLRLLVIFRTSSVKLSNFRLLFLVQKTITGYQGIDLVYHLSPLQTQTIQKSR